MTSKPLSLRDEIHGDMSFQGIAREVIDHPLFQRLRRIRQLGFAEYVFPCANHTRFQHSLGAGFLAQHYFQNVLEGWQQFPEARLHSPSPLKIEETRRLIAEITDNEATQNFWLDIATLAALLHDVGHGPWSHTFEVLNLPLDLKEPIQKLPAEIQSHFKTLTHPMHEDLSVLYTHEILSSTSENSELTFLSVVLLINKGLARSAHGKQLLAKLPPQFGPMITLIQPLISGPFDVDRIDYIQRDGVNCGVSLGGIEWQRIVNKVLPCLHQEKGVALISSTKNQHVLDDFIFSLFQMYTQVYLHPKVIGFEEEVKRVLLSSTSKHQYPTLTLKDHQAFTDDKFLDFLTQDLKCDRVRAILLREPKEHFQITGHAQPGFEPIEVSTRAMMKDSLEVALYTLTEDSRELFISPWTQVSPIAKYFEAVEYRPEIWIKRS